MQTGVAHTFTDQANYSWIGGWQGGKTEHAVAGNAGKGKRERGFPPFGAAFPPYNQTARTRERTTRSDFPVGLSLNLRRTLTSDLVAELRFL